MRDRLIELLDCVCRDYDDYCDECREGSGMSPMESFEEYAADYLLASGVVIVDPPKYPPVTNLKIIETIMGVPIDEVAELIEAKQEGRIIVPPCKVGDTVYIIDEGDEGSEDYVLSVKVMHLFINEHGIALDLQLPLGVSLYTLAMVGKTVFLTKEEAERALERSKE